MVRAHEAPNLSPLGNLLTLDLERCPYSHMLMSSTTITSVTLNLLLLTHRRWQSARSGLGTLSIQIYTLELDHYR